MRVAAQSLFWVGASAVSVQLCWLVDRWARVAPNFLKTARVAAIFSSPNKHTHFNFLPFTTQLGTVAKTSSLTIANTTHH